ncbi:MAG: peptidoglycan-binding domain-containing protein [Minicystis sp.]
MRPYVVRQGDYLLKLAFARGFDADEVWNDPKNADLKALRKDHRLLAPGDVVYVPEKEAEELPIQKGTTNRYVAKVPKVTLDLRFHDGDSPFANESYEVRGLGSPLQGTTDGEGRVSVKVPVHVAEVQVVFPDRRVAFPVRVGHLDPIEEPTGVRQRLQHLGFYEAAQADAPDWADLDAVERDRRAVTAFQTRHGLPSSGDMDDETRAALQKAHGA